MSAVCSRYVGCVRRLCWARLLRLSAALQTSSQTYATNLASNLCHEPRLKPMRARFSTLP